MESKTFPFFVLLPVFPCRFGNISALCESRSFFKADYYSVTLNVFQSRLDLMRGMFLIILFVGFLFEHKLYSQLILVGQHQGVTDLYYDASLALWIPSWITLQRSSLLDMQHWEVDMGFCISVEISSFTVDCLH